MRLTFFLAVLLVFARCSASKQLDFCSYDIPSTDHAGYCLNYDLSKLASLPGVSFSVPGSYNYTFSVCGDVVDLPAACEWKEASPAYQYSSSGCYALGQLNSSYVFPIDPTNSSAGIRIAYDNEEGGTSWPRAVVYDFICDPSAGTGKPLSVIEWPSYTYKVRWPTSYACAVGEVEKSCPLPVFDGTWDMLRFRPRPSWFDDVKFGIFLHWGIFSVPSFMNEWYWYRLMTGDAPYVEFHNRVYGCSGVEPDKFPCNGPNFTYPDFAPMFHAEFFNPDEWADLFKKAGAKYVVLTSKHHEGWCNWPSAEHWNWNSGDVGPHRDLVGDLADSVRAAGLRMGLYHSLREWYNPLYIQDNTDNCSTTSFVDEVLFPTMMDLVNRYKPEVFWADGAGDAPCTHDSVHYWKAPKFLSWLYNDSPVKNTIVANNRWGTPQVGDYTTGADRYSPGFLVPYKWESCFTVQKSSWGYDRTEGIEDFWNTSHLIQQLVTSVSCNGNLLLNVGPTVEGTIVPAFEERLLEMGAWLKINGEAIYNSVPWRAQNDTEAKSTWYTTTKDGQTVYAITYVGPVPGGEIVLRQPVPTPTTEVTMLGYPGGKLSFTTMSDRMYIKVPVDVPRTLQYAWTLKLTNVQ